MNSLKRMLIILVFVFLPNLVFAEWALQKEDDGVQVYLQDVPGSDIQAFKGVVRIQSSLDSLMAVFRNNSVCPDWFYQCKSSIRIESKSFLEQVIYQVSDFPFPSSDRDMIFTVSMSQDAANKKISIKIQSSADYCLTRKTELCSKINASDYVRMTTLSGQYTFEPQKDGWVEVIWEQHTEPGGNLPDWLVNAMVVDIPFETLKGLRNIVKKEEYQHSKLLYGPKGTVVGFSD